MNEWSWLQRLEIGARRQLLVRRENVTQLGLCKRILFASDLHLQKDGPRNVVAGILDIVSSGTAGRCFARWGSGGSERLGWNLVKRLIEDMIRMLPVGAVGGNHDRWIGLAQVREAVLEAVGGIGWRIKPLRWAPNAVAYGAPEQEL